MEGYKFSMGQRIRRIVLDALKPLKEPSIVEIAKAIASLPGVSSVNITVNEVDVETMGIIITIQGSNIDFESVEKKLNDLGVVIHSIDQVVVGEEIIEPALTQD